MSNWLLTSGLETSLTVFSIDFKLFPSKSLLERLIEMSSSFIDFSSFTIELIPEGNAFGSSGFYTICSNTFFSSAG